MQNIYFSLLTVLHVPVFIQSYIIMSCSFTIKKGINTFRFIPINLFLWWPNMSQTFLDDLVTIPIFPSSINDSITQDLLWKIHLPNYFVVDSSSSLILFICTSMFFCTSSTFMFIKDTFLQQNLRSMLNKELLLNLMIHSTCIAVISFIRLIQYFKYCYNSTVRQRPNPKNLHFFVLI